jgi:hypothetical protein
MTRKPPKEKPDVDAVLKAAFSQVEARPAPDALRRKVEELSGMPPRDRRS